MFVFDLKITLFLGYKFINASLFEDMQGKTHKSAICQLKI